jgi:hypothetical protein
MVSCSTVANITQSKYGIFARATHLIYGYMTIKAQIKVPKTSKISIEASKLFSNQIENK